MDLINKNHPENEVLVKIKALNIENQKNQKSLIGGTLPTDEWACTRCHFALWRLDGKQVVGLCKMVHTEVFSAEKSEKVIRSCSDQLHEEVLPS
jgi:hypothetical protein